MTVITYNPALEPIAAPWAAPAQLFVGVRKLYA
jgi:hypothetical protein